ncbi:hypothetical protein FRB90_011256 [Tulasnella sp. 427]|nr:hypothetical protein FRB90_011256 [Tulasnella sp. 427]
MIVNPSLFEPLSSSSTPGVGQTSPTEKQSKRTSGLVKSKVNHNTQPPAHHQMALAPVINFHQHPLTASSTAREPPPLPQPPELPPPPGATVNRQQQRIPETRALRDIHMPELLHLTFTYLPKSSPAARASEYLPRLVDTEDELAEETGSEVAPWEGKTLKDDGPDAIVNDQDVAVTSTLLETASFDDDDGVSYFDDTPITAANIRTVLSDRSTRPTPLTEAALAEMRASSRDVDLASSRNSSTTRSSQSPPPPPPGFETDEYPDLDASSAASGLVRRGSDASGSSSRLAGPLYNTESSTDDDDASGGAGAGRGSSLWNPLGFNFFNDNYTSEDDSASDDSFTSVSSDALQGGAHPPIDPPNRAFLQLVAESCPELEMLVLEEAWDFDRLTAEDAGGAGVDVGVSGTGTPGEPEVGPGTLSRVRLRVNFRSVEDAEERTEVLVKGIRRAMMQKTVNTRRPKFSRGFFLKPR